MRSITLVTLTTLAAGCSLLGESASSATVVRDSAGVSIAENDLEKLSATCTIDSAPAVTIGAEGGPPEYQLHRVFGARRLSDGQIVLANQGSQEIRFYDREGKFVRRAGREGQGPGEFSDAFHLWSMPGDTVWVGDYRPWEFEVFAPDGKWVRGVRPMPQYLNSPSPMIVLADGRSILGMETSLREGGNFAPRQVTIFIHAPDGTLLDTLGVFDNGRWGQISDDPTSVFLYPHFESFTRAAGGGSRLVIGHGSEAQLRIYEVSDSTRLVRIVRWTTPDRTVTPEDVRAEQERNIERYKDVTDPDMRRRLVEPLVNEKRPAAERFPAFTGVTAGRDGTIWVREYPTPRTPDARRMIAFDADGRFVCRMTLPPFEELLEIGADYLLAEDADDVGVERIVQYRVRRP